MRRMQIIMEESDLHATDRAVVQPARDYEVEVQERFGKNEIQGVVALALEDGRIVTGRTSEIMDASAAVIVNSLKALAGINDEIDLIAPMILNTILDLKREALHSRVPVLTTNELLIALSMSAVTNPTAKAAYDQLESLANCQAHATFILSRENEKTIKRLGIDITNDPVYSANNLLAN